MALGKRKLQRGVSRGASKAQQRVVGNRNPQRVALREERARGRVLPHGAAKPSIPLDGIPEGSGGSVSLERLWHRDVRAGNGRGIGGGARSCAALRDSSRNAPRSAPKARKPPREPGEPKRREGLGDLGGVEGGKLRVGKLDVEGGIGADSCNFAREQGVVHVGAEVLAHLALDLICVRNDLVKVAVLHDERRGFLGANARNTRNVVRCVTLEAIEIRNKVGRDAVVEVVNTFGSHDLDLRDALLC